MRTAGDPAAVRNRDHVWSEHVHESLHVAGCDGGQELLEDGELFCTIDLRPGPPRGDVFAGAVRDLSNRVRSLAQ